MDVASPPTARIAGRTTLDSEESTIITATRKRFTLATQTANGWHHTGGVRHRGLQHPSATGHGHRTP